MRSPRTATKSSPRLLQLEEAHAQQRRPNAAKNKFIFLKSLLNICSVPGTVLIAVNSAWTRMMSLTLKSLLYEVDIEGVVSDVMCHQKKSLKQ